MTATPVIVVLAAGRGSRFDAMRRKLSQPLGRSTVLGMTLSHAIGTGLPVVVVTTGPLATEAASLVAGRDVVTLSDSDARGLESGMGLSIAAGVAARPDATGWMVLPGDMPLVQSATIKAVAASLASHPVVFAQHRGRRGHPVGFSAELFSDLVQLRGDEGARRIVVRYPSHGVEVNDPGVLQDIDTEADLAAVRSAVADSVAPNAR